MEEQLQVSPPGRRGQLTVQQLPAHGGGMTTNVVFAGVLDILQLGEISKITEEDCIAF